MDIFRKYEKGRYEIESSITNGTNGFTENARREFYNAELLYDFLDEIIAWFSKIWPGVVEFWRFAKVKAQACFLN